MFPLNALSDSCFQFCKRFRLGWLAEKGAMDVCRGVLAGAAHDVMGAFFVPFQYRPRREPKFPPYLCRYRDLSLNR